ncbi:sucrose-6-phosphate hydrolase [Enterococcus pernyi]
MNNNFKWTRQLRYQAYQAWPQEYQTLLKEQVAHSPWRLDYHIQPPSGLLNDPNGFSFFNGKWHLFYQAYPMGAVHGLKSWYHLTSKNLVDWQEEGLKLLPSTSYDSHGVYSGSALPVNDKLFLAYTGNVRDENWARTSYQLGAWMQPNGELSKLTTPLISKPPYGYTQEFRDPQVIFYKDEYLLLLGAQNQNKQGEILVYRSPDLDTWSYAGPLQFTQQSMGFMIECPNLVFIDGKALLLFCPQGLEQSILEYQNIYPNAYIIGEAYDIETNQLTQPSTLKNLDEGFDLYATQAFNAPDGRALAVSWIGLPEISYPTDPFGWAHCLSIVKELTIENGTLYQRPVKEMSQLRIDPPCSLNHSVSQINTEQNRYEINLEFKENQSGKIHLCSDPMGNNGLILSFDRRHGKMKIDRSLSGEVFAEDYGVTREFTISQEPLSLQIFVDISVVEIFINDGKQTATARIFPSSEQTTLLIECDHAFSGTLWKLRKMNE